MTMTQRQSEQMGAKYFATPPVFDPEQGTTVFEPDGKGFGYWVGGHDVVFDPPSGKFYMFHRLRVPLGKGRGGVCRIAESTDGLRFTPIWEATKEQLDAESIEVGSLVRDPATGKWRLYICFEPPGAKWQIDVIEADRIEDLDPWRHRTVMRPSHYGVSFIKDPKVYIVGGIYHAFCCAEPRVRWVDNADGSRTAVGSDATVLLTSTDGVHFNRMQYVFEPGQGQPGEWGHFRARINSIVWLEPMWVAFFDGGQSSWDNYEEWTGVAISSDLLTWRRCSTGGPWVRSPHGCIRYLVALRVGDAMFYYYEYTREDGSHELRVSKVAL